MNWFVWRLHRKQFLIFTAILVVFTAIALPTGLHFWHVYQNALTNCKQNPALLSCSDLQNSLFQNDGAFFQLMIMAGFVLPAVIGLFLGSPLLAREYEEGTNKLAWTQSVSRRKWLTTKLAWSLVFAAAYGLILTLLITWWSKTDNSLNQSRFLPSHFDTQGLMPVAYSIFFTALGFSMGAWFRKTLVALGITLGLFVFFQIFFAIVIRPHYMAPLTVTAPMGPGILDSKIPSGSNWILARDIVDKNGKVIGDIFPSAPPQCQTIIQQQQQGSPGGRGIQIKPVPGGANPIDACLNAAGFHQVAKYQPSYRYWDFQRIEAGIYLGMTVIAVAATYGLVLKRDA